MTFLKNKSEFNLEASKILYEKSYYAPSVHCAYYSVFQLMKHILHSFCEISFEDQEIDRRNINIIKKDQFIGVHDYVISKIENELFRYDILTYRNLSNKIKDLKNFRLKSDYENIEITEHSGRKACQLSKEINTELKKVFRI